MRPKSVTKEQIYHYLKDNEWHTIGELAREYHCDNETIRSRLRELVHDQVSLIVGQQGYRLLRPQDMRDVDDAREVEQMISWIINSVSRLAMSGKSMKQLASSAAKFLPKSEGERQRLRSSFVKITHLIDWQESDII